MNQAAARYDVVVIGAGAAGLMCAMTAGQRGRRVLVLERANKVGKKILMSGGGRCNFTNLHVTPERFLSANPHFCKSALSRYTQWDFIELVRRHGIAYHEKTDGQLFCDDSAKAILAMLLEECGQAGVNIRTHCDVTDVESNSGFRVRTNAGVFEAQSLVIATGGLSIPSLGGSDFGYRVARQFGVPVLPLHAALVPFTLSGALRELSARLSGLSVRACISTTGASGSHAFTGDILFTHRGLSGPAVLQLSSYWILGRPVTVDLLPDVDAPQLLKGFKAEHARAVLRSVLAQRLPKRLVAELALMWWPRWSQTPLAEVPNSALEAIGSKLNAWSFTPAGTEGYRTAEVTLGGVDTAALSSRTMECISMPGLYFIGEVVDVTGHLGGFNFQWAWSSGYVAGQVV